MKKLLIIFTFIIPGFISAQKVKPAQFIETKIPAKNLRFRNDQFTFDSTILKDTFSISWFQNTESWKKLFPGTELFNPGDEWKISNHFIPSATRFSNKVIRDFIYDSDSLLFRVTELNAEQLNLLNLPFYFKNVEVTNGEYREFIRYVRDSIARRLLANVYPEEYLKIPTDFEGDNFSDLPLNWETEFRYYDPELMPILATMYYPNHERYYWQRQFDASKLIYKYYEYDPNYYDIPGKDIQGNMIPHSINVYPDTTVWVNQFYFSTMDRINRNYFWHEAYDDYPVVGITFEQAQAFCIWKTDQLKKKMAKLKLPFTFEVSLPKEHEWEYVLYNFNSGRSKNNDLEHYPFNNFSDYLSKDLDWKGDLKTKWDDLFVEDFTDDTLMVGYRKEIKRGDDMSFIITDNKLSNYYKICMYGPTTTKIDKACFTNNSICYESLSYNVSEWMDEDFYNYEKNWNIRFGSLLSDTSLNHQNAFRSEINNYSGYSLDSEVEKSGKLIRGSNWFDKEIREELPFNFGFANRKDFLPANSSRATVGFRYVIRLKPNY